MKPVAFDYARPDSLEATLALLAEHGEEATVLAGGLSMGPMLNMRLVRPTVLVDINRVPGLDRITVTDGQAVTGALVRQSQAMSDPDLAVAVPMLAQALPHVGHFQTRNRGTFGGSISHADPSAELPLSLLTCDGRVKLSSARGTREVAARNFFQGPLTTERRPDELLTALRWPLRPARTGHAFQEIAQRRGDFAIASAACEVTLGEDGAVDHLALGIGGVEDRPVLIDTGILAGEIPNADMVAELAAAAARQVSPVTDLQASADYRRALTRSLSEMVVGRAVEAAS